MKYLILLTLLFPAFIQSMAISTYLNKRLIGDSWLGDSQLDRIRQWIIDGADPNCVDARCYATPLVMAASASQRGTIELLLTRGANPNLEGSAGAPPLAHALKAYLGYKNSNHLPEFKYYLRAMGSIICLIRAGANVRHIAVQNYLQANPELGIVIKQAQEIAKYAGPLQKLH